MKSYYKLVRDKIPQIIKESGQEPIIEILSDEEYKRCLMLKLLEESKEYYDSDDIEELADVFEVLLCLLKLHNLTLADLKKIAQDKVEEKGSFFR